jgi:hypothetical protein
METHRSLNLTIARSEGSKVPDRLSSPDGYHNTNGGTEPGRKTAVTTLLFAYGTLMPADPVAAARQGWRRDAVRGRLYDLGPYPALIDLRVSLSS